MSSTATPSRSISVRAIRSSFHRDSGLGIRDSPMLTRFYSLLVIALLALAVPAHAQQERIGGTSPTQTYRAGWTFTPTFGFAETYDDNISLFGRNTAENQTDDSISTYFPGANLHYSGKSTRFPTSYSGSFLTSQPFTVLTAGISARESSCAATRRRD